MSKDITSNQIISIVGTTASGKTALALEIATANLHASRYQQVQLLSADSRQVYRGLEILTGADIPAGWTKQQSASLNRPCFHSPDGRLTLHGVSLIEPHQDWSVAHFVALYQQLRKQLNSDQQLIIVGGSGTYQKQLQGEFASLHVPPDPQLRSQLEQLSVSQLQQQLQTLSPARFRAMNNSDAHNPRRLVRAIEVERGGALAEPAPPPTTPVPTIRLAPPTDLAAKIEQRVRDRLPGALREIQALLTKYQLDPKQLPSWQSLSGTGIKPLLALLAGELDQTQCVAAWTKEELAYAKRQQLYLNKHI